MAIAVAKRPALMPTTPASRTNILNGDGGGSSDGISTAITPLSLQRRACARSTLVAGEALPDERLAALAPDVVQHQAAGHRSGDRHQRRTSSIAPGLRVTITTSSTSVMPGSGRNDESRNATRKRPGAPSASASAADPVDKFTHRINRVIIPSARRALLRGARDCGGRDGWRRVRRVALPPARPHAQPLRRARPPRRRAPHRRQHHAGWQQIGAVWLPLPHLLNAIPVQIDLVLSHRRVRRSRSRSSASRSPPARSRGSC